VRVLITWGSRHGGTEDIARQIGRTLHDQGIDAVLEPASAHPSLAGIDAVLVGGGLYANRWHRSSRRFVSQNVAALPVWFFSSGPLDRSAELRELPPVREVGALMRRIGAIGHATFGGRLAPDVKGFAASVLIRTHSGDWRNSDRVQAWATGVAEALPGARPRTAADPPGRALTRLVLFAAGNALAAAVVQALVLRLLPGAAGLTAGALMAPFITVGAAHHYFGEPGAREPAIAAAFFVAAAALAFAAADLVVSGSLSAFMSVAATWLPLAFIFAAATATGAVMTMIPDKRPGSAAHA
jgi:menaquinone-dependent protoporphyrinogen oxidase